MPLGKTTKVIIAEDHTLFADGIEQILATLPMFEVVAKVGNGKLLLQTLNSIIPDLILLDISMPHMDGMEAAIKIRKNMPMVKIIFLSMYYDKKLIEFAKQNNINGYLVKTITAPALKEAIAKVVGGGEAYILPFHHVTPDETDTVDKLVDHFKISNRELQIINLIIDGKSTKQISDELELSFYTVETHRKNIFKKIRVKNVAELVALVMNNQHFKHNELQYSQRP